MTEKLNEIDSQLTKYIHIWDNMGQEKKIDFYNNSREKWVATLQRKEATLHEEKVALRQEKAALLQKEAALCQEKAALQQKEGDIQREKAAIALRDADLIRERVNSSIMSPGTLLNYDIYLNLIFKYDKTYEL